MEKMWAGRFEKTLDKFADDFNSSIHFDSKMYRQDITGSMAHATMLAAQGIISENDRDEILKGLESILCDIDSGKLEFDMNADTSGCQVQPGRFCFWLCAAFYRCHQYVW